MLMKGLHLHRRLLILTAFCEMLLTAASACVQGNVIVVGRKSPFSLYDEKIASFEDDGGLYDQKDAAGFIKLQVWPISQELGCTSLSHKMKLFQASGAV